MTDFTMRAGDSLRIDTTVTNYDGSVRNLTSATGTFKVYDAPRGTFVMSGIFALNVAANGTVVSFLDDSQTDIYVGEYHVFYYEVKITESNGTETIVESGKLILS